MYLWSTKAPTTAQRGVLNISYMVKFGQMLILVKKAHIHANTFHLSLQPSLYGLPYEGSSLYKLMFWKKAAVCGYFGQIWSTSGGKSGRNCPKGHLHANSFYLSIQPNLHDLLTIRLNPNKFIIRKTHCFWQFWPILPLKVGRIWPKLSKMHIYT